MGRTGCEVKNETEGMDIFFSFFLGFFFFLSKLSMGLGWWGNGRIVSVCRGDILKEIFSDKT